MSEPAISLDDAGYQNLRAVADRLLETTRVEYVDEGVLLIMNPPGIEHRRIVRAIVDDAKRAFYTGAIAINWATDENYQWDLPDGAGRFYIPDIAFIHPDARTAEEERAAISLVVEVTSPTSPDTVHVVVPRELNDEQRSLFEQLAETMGSEIQQQANHRSFFDKVKDALGV